MLTESFEIEFSRILSMDRFAFVEGETVFSNRHLLIDPAFQMHLDARLVIVPDGAMGKGVEIEIRIEFAIDPGQQIEIEGRGHTGRIIISRD